MPQAPAWDLYPAARAGEWANHGACTTPTGRLLDSCDDTTATITVARCQTCPVIAPCREWQHGQIPEARAYGAVGGQWWGLDLRKHGRTLRVLDPVKVEAAAGTDAWGIPPTPPVVGPPLPEAVTGQGVLIELSATAATRPCAALRRPKRHRYPATALWTNLDAVAAELAAPAIMFLEAA